MNKIKIDMTEKKENIQSVFDNMKLGDRIEDNRSHDYLNRERSYFHKRYLDRRIVIVKSKFKKGVNIIMRAE